ncbi:MAG: 16S rRNA (uracil(1498)-N(3))-methyltransferase [Planctomycetota bacterium]
MANLYLVPEIPAAGTVLLDGDTAHHLLRVLRVRPGDHVELGDGRGRIASARVLELGRHDLRVRLAAAQHVAAIRPALTLAFACPRQNRADWLIEHGTEVGVACFQPLWTARSRPQNLRLERWQKIAAAAAGQCARAWLPQIAEAQDLEAWLSSELPARRLLADEYGSTELGLQGVDDATTQTADTALLVGPEGGLKPAERDRAIQLGFQPIQLGPHILRTETAALVGAALVIRQGKS